jgi:hypothetical protein
MNPGSLVNGSPQDERGSFTHDVVAAATSKEIGLGEVGHWFGFER